MSSFKKDDEKTHTTHEDIAAAAQHGFKTNGVLPYAHCAAAVLWMKFFPINAKVRLLSRFRRNHTHFLGVCLALRKRR